MILARQVGRERAHLLGNATNVVRFDTETDREAVSARSASQCLGTAELI